MQIMADFMPSSFGRIECIVKNAEEVVISRSSASVADATNDAKQITCAAFGSAPVVPYGLCEWLLIIAIKYDHQHTCCCVTYCTCNYRHNEC